MKTISFTRPWYLRAADVSMGRMADRLASSPSDCDPARVTASARLADLLAALSLATDLGSGVPLETSLRTCLVASELARGLGLGGPARRAVYYSALLRHLGCTAWSHEAAELVGDDHELTRTFEGVDAARRSARLGRTLGVARDVRFADRVRAIGRVLRQPRAGAELAAAQCAQAATLADDLGFDRDVRVALGQIYERYDGRGLPNGVAGDQLTPVARVIHAAELLEILHRRGGRDHALAEVKRRRGGALAPDVCDLALREAGALWPLLESPAASERALDAEPEPRSTIAPAQLAQIALAFARFADLKIPHRIGHSTQVAALAARAAERAGWPADDVERLRLAALLHDLGTVSVGNQLWEHPGPLGSAAIEQSRLHAYYSERILRRTATTAPLAEIAGAHHERLDGSGYHHGRRGDALSSAARLLAACDVASALGEARPHRPALDRANRCRILADEAASGRLCRTAVELVSDTGDAIAPTQTPAGLTERETAVLALLARGLATKEIAAKLGIAPRTVKHHIEHVYEKTGISSRAAAALFAVRHDLVAPGEIVPRH
jgi:HD-GYP domain-containing protein (c-di-GMP phosphodiesterase class II)